MNFIGVNERCIRKSVRFLRVFWCTLISGETPGASVLPQDVRHQLAVGTMASARHTVEQDGVPEREKDHKTPVQWPYPWIPCGFHGFFPKPLGGTQTIAGFLRLKITTALGHESNLLVAHFGKPTLGEPSSESPSVQAINVCQRSVGL